MQRDDDVKIILTSEYSIRLEPAPGPMTIEAMERDGQYSPFHMLASSLAYCTVSVMHSWATHTKQAAGDLVLEVHWKFSEDEPRRVSDIQVTFEWPSLPAKKLNAARRVAEMCTIHATLLHPPRIVIEGAGTGPAPRSETCHYTLVYDGMCRMCTRLSSVLKNWDSRREIEVVPSQATGVMARFPWIPARAYAEAIQLVGPGGETWQGAEAIEQLLGILPRGNWIGWIFRIPFVRALADRLYRWVARHRYRLGCGEHCQRRPLDLAFPE